MSAQQSDRADRGDGQSIVSHRLSAIEEEMGRLRDTIHGTDSNGGMVGQFAEVKVQLKSIAWTIKVIGGATLTVLVGIFFKLATAAAG